MTLSRQVRDLADQIQRGSDRALSRGLTQVERWGPEAEDLLARVFPYTGGAHVVGITGSPGSGKSTLTRALARAAHAQGLSIGILAVDPSSPYSGGSILGDRIRMNDLASELGIFIRSLATHGALGGLSRAAVDSIDLMDAAGKELIFVETVGVGQDEVDIMQAAHTVVVVSVPGLGDEVQTLKAGILEIADVHAVNKADREGADRIRAELQSMLALGARPRYWNPPVVACSALKEENIGTLLAAISDHFKALKESGEFEKRQKRMARARILALTQQLVAQASANADFNSDDLLDRVLRRELAPHAASRELLARLAAVEARSAQHV